MNNNLVTGVDIGGSHITAALIDLQSHSVIHDSMVRQAINAKGNVRGIIKQWTNAIIDCKSFNLLCSKKIGIAMPGPFDYEKGISLISGLDKYESLYNLNVKELLADTLKIEVENIFMINDATCFLKGEIFCGTANDCKNVVGITLGTGLGSATFNNAILYDGDLYYTPFKNQTAEDYLSTRWFLKRYKELTGIMVNNVKEISQLVTKDENAGLVFIEFGKNLGEVLAEYIQKHQGKKVIIGGNIIRAWDLFINETKIVLNSHSIKVELLKARLGEEAILMGAGSLCL